MKKKFLLTILGLFLGFGLSVVFNMFRFNYGFEDAFCRTLLAPIEGTVWKEGFSESDFAKIKIGMKKKEVREFLGHPIDQWCQSGRNGDSCTWKYTVHKQVQHHDRRIVYFDANDRVDLIHHDFWVD